MRSGRRGGSVAVAEPQELLEALPRPPLELARCLDVERVGAQARAAPETVWHPVPEAHPPLAELEARQETLEGNEAAEIAVRWHVEGWIPLVSVRVLLS